MALLTDLMLLFPQVIPLATDAKSGGVDPYAIGTGIVYGGPYTPVITNGTNVSASSINPSMFIRIGPVVIVGATGNVTTTTALNTTSSFAISLPVASNLQNISDLAGTGTRGAPSLQSPGSVIVQADVSAKRAVLTFNSTAAGTQAVAFLFIYTVK